MPVVCDCIAKMVAHHSVTVLVKMCIRDRLYSCIKELYEQGVPFSELKALIPDIRRTREQLHIKRMLENNNEVLLSMISKEMSFLLDAKERQEEEEFRKLDQLIRQQQSFRKSAAGTGPVEKLKKLFLPA